MSASPRGIPCSSSWRGGAARVMRIATKKSHENTRLYTDPEHGTVDLQLL